MPDEQCGLDEGEEQTGVAAELKCRKLQASQQYPSLRKSI